MSKWLEDLKDSDKVALAILFLGVLITFVATGGYLLVIFKSGLIEADMDRAVTIVKDFFGVGTGLIGASLLALKLQPKPPASDVMKTETIVSTSPPSNDSPAPP